MTTNIYHPLDPKTRQIRLLTLQPSHDSTTLITGQITIVDLDSPQGFEAVSWVWGSPLPPEPIMLNGQMMEIPFNAKRALEQFRLSDGIRTLWIDAICINQNNEREREAQVALMGDIYTAAAKILVWLGQMQSADEDGFTFNCWNRLGDGISLRQIFLERIGISFATTPSDQELNNHVYQFLKQHPHYGNSELLHILLRFFNLDWWKRLWVLQEVALASEAELFWGGSMISFAKLKNAYNGLLREFRNNETHLLGILTRPEVQNFLDACGKSMDTAQQLEKIRRQILPVTQTIRGPSLQMIEVLASGRTRIATRKHDKVFGMLGLLDRGLARHFPISYETGWQEVYIKTAERLLNLSETFMLFGCIRDPWLFSPSWCPSWDFAYHQVQNVYLRRLQEPIFDASNAARWNINFIQNQPEPPILEVKGFRLDIIERERGANNDSADSASLYFLLHWFLRMSNNTLFQEQGQIDQRHHQFILRSSYITGAGLLDAVCKIWFNDCEPFAEYNGIQRLTDQNLDRFKHWFLTADNDSGLSSYRPAAIRNAENLQFAGIDSPSMLDFVRSVIKGKSFFYTTLGYCGLVDYEIQKEDDVVRRPEVWILAGGSQPVVLYPAKQKPGSYYVCSEAYVHGVMNGEAVRAETPRLDDGNDGRRDESVQPREFRTIRLL